jgi:hypothetical protein
MKTKYPIIIYTLLAVTILSGMLYAQDIMWRVKCTTKGCNYTTDWNGNNKVVQQWSAHHVRENPGHTGAVEGKGKK